MLSDRARGVVRCEGVVRSSSQRPEHAGLSLHTAVPISCPPRYSGHGGSTGPTCGGARIPLGGALCRVPHRWDPRSTRSRQDSCRPYGSTPPVRVDQRVVRPGDGGGARHPPACTCRATSSYNDVVDQRILEQSARIRSYGAITAWAALRWHGATFFDGTCDGGVGRLPVPLISHTKLNPDPRFTMTQDQLASSEWLRVDGVPVTTVQRALSRGTPDRDGAREGQRDRDGRGSTLDLDPALRAVRRPPRPLDGHPGCPRRRTSGGRRLPIASGVPDVPVLASRCRPSDAASRPRVYDLDGRLVGIPDLFDEEAGLVGEYQGEDHKDGQRHREDVEREEKFRDHGLEFFEVVGGDLARRQLVVDRMRNARARPSLGLPSPVHGRSNRHPGARFPRASTRTCAVRVRPTLSGAAETWGSPVRLGLRALPSETHSHRTTPPRRPSTG